MAHLLGDWDFLHYWWWKPYLEFLVGLAWFAGVIAIGALIFFAITGSTRLAEYRASIFPPKEPEIPEDEAALVEFMESFFPETSEEEILGMETIIEDVLREDVDPQAAHAIEERGIPVRLLTLPPPEVVRAARAYPLAAWVPHMGAIEVYASTLKGACLRDPRRYRQKIGEVLADEIARALEAQELEDSDPQQP